MSSIGPTDNSNKIVLPIGYTVEADETVDEILQETKRCIKKDTHN